MKTDEKLTHTLQICQGKRAAGTWLVALRRGEVLERLKQTAVIPGVVPSVKSFGLEVADLAARARDMAAGELLCVDNTLMGAYTCPALMRGADVVVDGFASVPYTGAPVVSVTLSRAASGVAEVADLVAALSRDFAPSAAQVDALEEALIGAHELAQKRSDAARALANYLSCHPSVTAVCYPGLADDSSHEVAARTLEHGFGAYVEFACAGQAPEQLVAKAHTLEAPGATRTKTSFHMVRKPAAGATVQGAANAGTPDAAADTLPDELVCLVAGDEEPLALVMLLERLLG